MHNDEKLLSEAYATMLEKAEHCRYAVNGCECEECEECLEHKEKEENKKSEDEKELSPKQKKLAQKAPPFNKITGADFAASKNKKKKAKVKESFEPAQHMTRFEEAFNDVLGWFND